MAAETIYAQNIHKHNTRLFTVHLSNCPQELYLGIREWLTHNNLFQPTLGDVMILKLTGRTASALLASVSDADVRKQIWLAMLQSESDIKSGLGNLLKSRQKLAKFLGYESYAHKYLSNKVFKTPEQVKEFLLQTSESLKPQATSEYSELANLIIDDRHDNGLSGRNDRIKNSSDISLWDLPYASSLQTSSDITVSNYHSKHRMLSEYLSVKCVLSGLQLICGELFGIDLKVVSGSEIDSHEVWCPPIADDGAPLLYKLIAYKKTNHSDLELNLNREAEDPLGIIYLDLFGRPLKFSGAAHFNVQSACTNISENSKHHANSMVNLKRQVPVVVLAMSIDCGMSASAQEVHSGVSTDRLVEYNTLQTIYHEFGHALNSVLSATHYQHLAGTRGPTDLAEVRLVTLLLYSIFNCI